MGHSRTSPGKARAMESMEGERERIPGKAMAAGWTLLTNFAGLW
jgi:hypothetical protein